MTILRPKSCHYGKLLRLLVALVVIAEPVAPALAQRANSTEELQRLSGEAGRFAGRL
jgi:hypothetical protein